MSYVPHALIQTWESCDLVYNTIVGLTYTSCLQTNPEPYVHTHQKKLQEYSCIYVTKVKFKCYLEFASHAGRWLADYNSSQRVVNPLHNTLSPKKWQSLSSVNASSKCTNSQCSNKLYSATILCTCPAGQSWIRERCKQFCWVSS